MYHSSAVWRFPKVYVGYGWIVSAMSFSLRPCRIASVHSAIISPAFSPRMLAPRILPEREASTFTNPVVLDSVTARSSFVNGNRYTSHPGALLAPTRASSGLVKVHQVTRFSSLDRGTFRMAFEIAT